MRAPLNTAKERKLFPSGLSGARCWIVADLGTQRFAQKPNEEGTRKLLFVFESTEYFDTFDAQKGEEPFIIMHELAFFMNSANPSKKTNLRKFIEGWRGNPLSEEEARNYDFDPLPGQPAILSVLHTEKANGGTKAVIQAANKPRPGEQLPKLRGKPVLYSLEDGQGGAFLLLPKWIQTKVLESDEMKGIAPQPAQEHEPDFTQTDANSSGVDEETNVPF